MNMNNNITDSPYRLYDTVYMKAIAGYQHSSSARRAAIEHSEDTSSRPVYVVKHDLESGNIDRIEAAYQDKKIVPMNSEMISEFMDYLEKARRHNEGLDDISFTRYA